MQQATHLRPTRLGSTLTLAAISLLCLGAHLASTQATKSVSGPASSKSPLSQQTPATSPSRQQPSTGSGGYARQASPQQQQAQAQQVRDESYQQQSDISSLTRRKQQQQVDQQQQQQLQQQQDEDGYPINSSPSTSGSSSSSNGNSYGNAGATTEDPLVDSEPALYGSVAGAPGVDFPAYTRIPKTSFTCEGKDYDFGFYADEEAQCQVYHVCWSGRRESFLCGVGTVFNQAILACDYWHSVDCSKSSQFWGINSELGKASPEPKPADRQQQLQSPALIGNQRGFRNNNNNNNNNANQLPAEPISQKSPAQAGQRANGQLVPASGGAQNNRYQQQQQIQEDAGQELLQQQQQDTSYNQPGGPFVAQRKEPASINQQQQQQQQPQQQQQLDSTTISSSTQSNARDYQQQQQQQSVSDGPSKVNQQQPLVSNQQRTSTSPSYSTQSSYSGTSTLASPALVPSGKRRVATSSSPLSKHKLSSLIESPVRAALGAGKRGQPKSGLNKPPGQLTRPGQVQSPVNQPRPSAGKQPKRVVQAPVALASLAKQTPIQQQALRQPEPIQQYDNSLNDNSNSQHNHNNLNGETDQQEQQNQYQQQQQQPQQSTFDDSPSGQGAALGNSQQAYDSPRGVQQPQQPQPANRLVASQQMIIHAGGNSPDGSSAITSQYDTYNGQQELVNYNQPQLQQQAPSPTQQQQQQLQNQQHQHQQQQIEQQQQQQQTESTNQAGAPAPSSSSSALADDSGTRLSVAADEDFRSSGARAAASNKQNWYIMRTI